jgi:hypothetical protein
MDHVDWLEQGDIDILCAALKDQVKVVMFLCLHKCSLSTSKSGSAL